MKIDWRDQGEICFVVLFFRGSLSTVRHQDTKMSHDTRKKKLQRKQTTEIKRNDG